MTPQEDELLKNAKNMVDMLEDDKQHDPREVYIIINKIIKILGPSYSLIPVDMKKALGVAYATSIGEPEPVLKAGFTRSALGILRGTVVLAHGPKKQLNDIDAYIFAIDREMRRVDECGEDAMTATLWSLANRANDYLGLMIFNGYGEINSRGFNFTRKEEIKGDVPK